MSFPQTFRNMPDGAYEFTKEEALELLRGGMPKKQNVEEKKPLETDKHDYQQDDYESGFEVEEQS